MCLQEQANNQANVALSHPVLELKPEKKHVKKSVQEKVVVIQRKPKFLSKSNVLSLWALDISLLAT